MRLETRPRPAASRADAQRAGNRLGDLFLHREHALQLAVVAFGPEMRAVAGLDELRGDAHLVPVLAHRALDEMGRVQGLGDGLNVAVLAFELEGRGAGDDAQGSGPWRAPR